MLHRQRNKNSKPSKSEDIGTFAEELNRAQGSAARLWRTVRDNGEAWRKMGYSAKLDPETNEATITSLTDESPTTMTLKFGQDAVWRIAITNDFADKKRRQNYYYPMVHRITRSFPLAESLPMTRTESAFNQHQNAHELAKQQTKTPTVLGNIDAVTAQGLANMMDELSNQVASHTIADNALRGVGVSA